VLFGADEQADWLDERVERGESALGDFRLDEMRVAAD
jgi:hypothetical protein